MEQYKTKLQNLIDMSVLSYLNSLSSKLVIGDEEKMSISKSINALNNHLKVWEHYDCVSETLVFGSFDRETILPRWADNDSDIDYMIVFRDSQNYQPQTYLNWLRDFASNAYSRSEIYQSHPTVVLELSKIKFELVPAIKPWGYMIPTNTTYYSRWQSTDPKTLKGKVTNANVMNSSIRPLIRVMKYWNVRHGRPYASFELEDMISSHLYWGANNLEECFYSLVDSLPVRYEFSQIKKNAINILKYRVNQARLLKQQGLYYQAEIMVSSIYE